MLKRSTFLALSAVIGVAASAAAQDSRFTDGRLYPFLGCWRSDSAGVATARLGTLTCVVPVSGSPSVEMVNIVDGRVASRRRLEASSRAHPVEGQGCRGQERTSWSPLVRRIYLRSEYVCATGIAGGSTTLHAFLPDGEWVEIENVRSGSGSILRVERRRDAGVPNGLPRELAGLIGYQRLAVMTARAEAASPLKPDDIIEAIRNSDTAVVRVWLLVTAQNFQLSGDQFASLTQAQVPAPILQAMMAAPPKYQLGTAVDHNGRSTDEYLNTPGVGVSYPAYVGYPYYAYSRPYYYGYPYYHGYPYYCCGGGGYSSSSANVYVNNSTTAYPQSYASYYNNGFNGYGYENNYYAPYSFGTVYRRYPVTETYSAPPVYTSYRAPSYYSNPVGVQSSGSGGGGQVHVIPASPAPVGRRP